MAAASRKLGLSTGLLLLLSSITTSCCQEHDDPIDIIQNEHDAKKYIREYNTIPFMDLEEMISRALNSTQINVEDIKDVMKGLDNYLGMIDINLVNNETSQCGQDVIQFLQDLFGGQSYATQMLDSLGKLPSGVLTGNLKWIGSYEQCEKVVAPTFRGKYCSASVRLPLPPPLSQVGNLNVGFCAPSSCGSQIIDMIIRMGLESPQLSPFLQGPMKNVVLEKITCKIDSPYSKGDIAAIVILSVLALLSALGTMYDAAHQIGKYFRTPPSKYMTDGSFIRATHPNESLLDTHLNEDTATFSSNSPRPYITHDDQTTSLVGQLLVCFSWLRNGSKLLDTTVKSGNLSSVNGIRVLSMWWVILGHTYVFSIGTADNILSAYSMTQRFSFQAIANATFSVDTFFFLSGLLVAYLTLKELHSQQGRINWFMFYFHRFWRLTPVYMITLMFYTTLWSHIPEGPFTVGDALKSGREMCYKYWWSNLLYINNFVPGDLNGECMGWAWYLANDMQFYVISPLIIYILYRWWKAGMGIVIGMILISLGITGGIARSKHIQSSLIGGGTTVGDAHLYIRPYYRISAYLVGLVAGYVIYHSRCKLRMPRIVCVIGWGVAIATNGSVLYGLYDYNKDFSMMNMDVSALYTAVSRFSWSMGLAWLTVACVTGYGGPVNRFLSWSAWVPLGRLTYCAYLVHPIVIFTALLNRKALIHVDDITMIYLYAGHIVMSYLVAFCVSMLVEAPMMALEKVIFKRQGRSSENNTNNAHLANIDEQD